jgi:hypothetical protein
METSAQESDGSRMDVITAADCSSRQPEGKREIEVERYRNKERERERIVKELCTPQ